MLTVEVVLAADASGVAAVQTLWREYWQAQSLPPHRDHFMDELLALPGSYSPPGGRLLLARVNGVPAGTVALRGLPDARYCEGKRMFVRTEFRGQGVAEALVIAVMDEATLAGYQALYAEVLQGMTAALALYRRFGFVETESYAREPAPDGIPLRRALGKTLAATG